VPKDQIEYRISLKINLLFTVAKTEKQKQRKTLTVFTTHDVEKLPIISLLQPIPSYMHKESEAWLMKLKKTSLGRELSSRIILGWR
jgi:hypothetical protein